MSIKLARMIRFDPVLSVVQKIKRLEAMGDIFAEMCKREDLGFFCTGEEAIYAISAGMLAADNASIEDVIRIREKPCRRFPICYNSMTP